MTIEPSGRASALVSILVPTLNRPDYLREALASALGQTHTNIEVIVADNGGLPETREVIRSFADLRLTYVVRAEDIGMLRNNVALFNAARGTYVANLHDDDRWREDFLETLVPILEVNPQVGVAFCDHLVIDERGEVDRERSERVRQVWRRDRLTPGLRTDVARIGLLTKSIPMVQSAVIRRSVVTPLEIDPRVDTAYDLWLTYLISRSGMAAYYHADWLAFNRSHPRSATSTMSLRVEEAAAFCYGAFAQDPSLADLREDLLRREAFHSTNVGILLLKDGRRVEARDWFGRALDQGFGPRAALGRVASRLPGGIARATIHGAARASRALGVRR